MKIRKKNTDVRINIDIKVGPIANDNSNPPREEWVLPDHRRPDPDIIECFVPVEPGEEPRIVGRAYGTYSTAIFDLVADGAFCYQSRTEPPKYSQANERIKYHKSRTIHFKEALTNPDRSDWKTQTEIRPREVYLGKLTVKALTEDEKELLEEDQQELRDPTHQHPGVGSLMMVVSLVQDSIATYGHNYPSVEIGSWKDKDPRIVLDSGIAPDHSLELVAHDQQEPVPALTKRSKKFRTRFEEERPGFKPFVKIIYHFRSEAAIKAAGCIKKENKTYIELVPALPKVWKVSGGEVNYTMHGEALPNTEAVPLDNGMTYHDPRVDVEALYAAEKEALYAAKAKDRVHEEDEEGPEEDEEVAVDTTEDHEEPEVQSTKSKLGGTLILPTELKKKFNKLGGTLRLSPQVSKSSSIVKGHKEKQSKSKSPETLGEKIDDLQRPRKERESPQNTTSEGKSQHAAEHDHEDQDNDMNLDDCAEDGDGWSFDVLEPIQDTQQTADTTNADLVEEDEAHRQSADHAPQQPLPQASTVHGDLSASDLTKIPGIDTLRAAIPAQGIHEEALADILDRAGPFQNYEQALYEFGNRLKTIATKVENNVTAYYYLNEHFGPASHASKSLSQALPTPSAAAAPQLPQQKTGLTRDIITDKHTDRIPQDIKQEEVETTTDIRSRPTTYLQPVAQSRSSTMDHPSPTTTDTSSTKKRKSSSVLENTTDSPAKVRKTELDAKIAAIRAQVEAKKRETELLRQAREQRAADKKKREEEKRQRKEAKRLEQERKEAELAAAELELAQQELLDADEARLAEAEMASEDEDGESSDTDESDEGVAGMDE